MVYSVRQYSKLEFPPIVADFIPGEDHWPGPPFAWDHDAIDRNALQPCKLQLRHGPDIDGNLCAFEPTAGRLLFRKPGASATASVPFERLRACVLTQPLTPQAHAGKVPTQEHERDFHVEMVDGRLLSGATVGRVEASCGLFLFPPVDVDRSVSRLFVPRSAYNKAEFGPTVVERAATAWVTAPDDLLAAIERQAKAPVLPMGRALTNLGLATPRQIERALAVQAQHPDRPLGQILVAAGVVSQSDLRAAMAHKLGCPLVDVDRFPLDLRAAARLPLRTVMSAQALPLMLRGERIILAVPALSSEAELRMLRMTTGLVPVVVLARRSALARRLAALATQDIWEQAVPLERLAGA